ncbi:hypothetical protein DENSPDRAFT_181699 [Dentipellis sp. KUC8613]|nr:hypothetical protein DENSPDRAFT_181699 [Dentipellis sp. KUC8613]
MLLRDGGSAKCSHAGFTPVVFLGEGKSAIARSSQGSDAAALRGDQILLTLEPPLFTCTSSQANHLPSTTAADGGSQAVPRPCHLTLKSKLIPVLHRHRSADSNATRRPRCTRSRHCEGFTTIK